jgi:phosphoribosylformylglycinamidine synthase
LDFASVQRDNAEMERRCQEVIDHCTALGDKNPMQAIHDVGAGGLSNVLPEIVHDSGRGAIIQLRSILCDDKSLSPMEIWCNESQERYVCAVRPADLPVFEAICRRERCPFAAVGVATVEERLQVLDSHFKNAVIDLPMSILFGKPPKMHRVSEHRTFVQPPLQLPTMDKVVLREAVHRVLRHPTVASKSFLITIGDRSVTGLVHRDQMVGPYQVPVADVAVTATSYDVFTGEAMAMGERPPLAVIDAAASARMAFGESLTNIAAADIESLSRVRLSANWMASAGHEGEGAALYDAVKALAIEACPQLGVTIPVGKDSMSMKTTWKDGDRSK